jgi:predicted ATP-grasp superfamily ATP-dependent carboligase
MYTGGLENHPESVEFLSRGRLLWGNSPETLVQVRNPQAIASLLRREALPFLEVRPGEDPPEADSNWVRKPSRGAAGRGITIWNRAAADRPLPVEPVYFQSRRSGQVCSASFLGFRGGAQLLSINRQLVGMAEVNAQEFAWCGALTGESLPARIESQIARVGAAVQREFSLRGLFGCDFVVDNDAWLTEVNPRYTASMELTEARLGVPLVGWHIRACATFDNQRAGDVPMPPAAQTSGPARHTTPPVTSKIILFAPADSLVRSTTRFIMRDITFPSPARVAQRPPAADFMLHPSSFIIPPSLPFAADLPAPGSRVNKGQPVCTLFARGSSSAECLARLVRRARMFVRRYLERD